jgi:hypothetical protein
MESTVAADSIQKRLAEGLAEALVVFGAVEQIQGVTLDKENVRREQWRVGWWLDMWRDIGVQARIDLRLARLERLAGGEG